MIIINSKGGSESTEKYNEAKIPYRIVML